MEDKSSKGQLMNFALCDVLDVKDDCEGLRIKVAIPGTTDMDGTIDDLPFCFPALPKMLNINPKVGEKVIVWFQNPQTPGSLRLFLGPVVVQDYMLSYAPGSVGDKSIVTQTILSNVDSPDASGDDFPGYYEAPSRNSENEGTLLPREAIALRGRKNNDIILKENETQIRCGFLRYPNDTDSKLKLNYNPVDLGYIQLKYKDSKDEKDNDYKSSINIVADRVNILSHDSGTYFSLGEKNNLITDDEMSKILQQAHALPYGDVLIAFLKEFVRVFKEHSHPFHQEPPCLSETNEKAISKDLDEMLSKSIKIN